MKVISLNAWGGKGGVDLLITFLKKHKEVDIFCLQEIWDGGEEMIGSPAARFTLENIETELLERIREALPEHVVYFRPHLHDFFGLALLVRNEHAVLEEGEIDIYKEKGYVPKENIGDMARILQYVSLENPSCTVSQVHGLWNGKGKEDSDERLLQSEKILNFLRSSEGPQIVLGDFNLRPGTESIRMLEKAGFRNLISEFDIQTTRTNLYDWKEKEPYADYVFVNDRITVLDFKVLPDEVTDHAALYLEFAIV